MLDVHVPRVAHQVSSVRFEDRFESNSVRIPENYRPPLHRPSTPFSSRRSVRNSAVNSYRVSPLVGPSEVTTNQYTASKNCWTPVKMSNCNSQSCSKMNDFLNAFEANGNSKMSRNQMNSQGSSTISASFIPTEPLVQEKPLNFTNEDLSLTKVPGLRLDKPVAQPSKSSAVPKVKERTGKEAFPKKITAEDVFGDSNCDFDLIEDEVDKRNLAIKDILGSL